MNRLIIFYDDWCPYCTRFAMLVKKTDWFHLIEIQKMRELKPETSALKLSAHQTKKQEAILANDLDLEKAQKQMASVEVANSKERKNKNSFSQPHKIFYGFISIYKILLRLPIYWILFFYTFPFLFLLKISGMGDLLYEQVAVKRKIIPLHCDESCEVLHNKKL